MDRQECLIKSDNRERELSEGYSQGLLEATGRAERAERESDELRRRVDAMERSQLAQVALLPYMDV